MPKQNLPSLNEIPTIGSNPRHFQLFYVYYRLPWEHNLERNQGNLSKILKGTDMQTPASQLCELIEEYEWEKAASLMDQRVSGQLQKNMEKTVALSVSKYMKTVENIIDRFSSYIEQADPDDPIIDSISDFEKLIKLQLHLVNIPENGRITDGGEAKSSAEALGLLEKDVDRIENIKQKVIESTRTREQVAAIVDESDVIDCEHFEEV